MKLDFYALIIFIHVVSAVLSIGPLFILMPTIKRLRGVDMDVETAYLSIVNVVIRIVMHAGHALVVSGVLLLIFGPWPWYTSWVVMTVAVMLLSGLFLSRGFTFVLRRFHRPGENKNKILHRLNQTSWIYIGLMLIMLWLMVQKPVLW
ncbi:hypothetical protein JSQ81_04380 [Sporosarcina sp. Marseille-Q4063]|uniref:hypothetical protein n=1 Tax=Sporosarcina sp. Marseille-Q4063 TaxID=2810514 RepID=UPI001BB095B9|nr:hypothetical protein [Sporosarcina sp. Marseille-Q4063]QUW22826.1 hypothetical protein JSQ81_04380 [Sporosarcina sp. Marseille-Q4063]